MRLPYYPAKEPKCLHSSRCTHLAEIKVSQQVQCIYKIVVAINKLVNHQLIYAADASDCNNVLVEWCDMIRFSQH